MYLKKNKGQTQINKTFKTPPKRYTDSTDEQVI